MASFRGLDWCGSGGGDRAVVATMSFPEWTWPGRTRAALDCMLLRLLWSWPTLDGESRESLFADHMANRRQHNEANNESGFRKTPGFETDKPEILRRTLYNMTCQM